MSKGSPIVPVRIPPEVLKEVDAVVERSITRRRDGAWTRSSFIIEAVTEKLAKMQRSRAWRRRKRRAPAIPAPQPAPAP